MERVRRFLKKAISIIKRPEMRVLPGQLAFFFVLSIIPIIALVGTIASYFSISIESISSTLSESLPSEISTTLLSVISGEGLNFNIMVFFISAFLLASNGTHSMIVTSNEIYKVNSDDVVKRRVKAVLMTFIIVGLILFLFIVPIFGNKIFDILYKYSYNRQLIDFFNVIYRLLKYPLSLLFIYLNIKLLYTIAPDKIIPSSTTTKGAMFTTITWLVATEIYSFYIGTFSKYDIFYGSISNILILLIWVYILSYIFVLGMAFNASAIEVKEK